MGVNPFARVEEATLLKENCDKEDKWFPYGLTCNVQGKKIPCFIGHSESGSITSELLASMLKHNDDCKGFNQTNSVPPFLLLNVHGSRFKLPFLEYINNVEHKWMVCIGVPYGTSIWQVGDSAKQNGSFKMAIL